MNAKNRIMIYGLKNDGTYVVAKISHCRGNVSF